MFFTSLCKSETERRKAASFSYSYITFRYNRYLIAQIVFGFGPHWHFGPRWRIGRHYSNILLHTKHAAVCWISPAHILPSGVTLLEPAVIKLDIVINY